MKTINIETIVDTLFTALWYNYDIKDIITIVDDVKFMVEVLGTRNRSDEASYIFSVLVLLYGDYGVAPAVGWIYKELKKPILDAIDKWCNDGNIYESEELQ